MITNNAIVIMQWALTYYKNSSTSTAYITNTLGEQNPIIGCYITSSTNFPYVSTDLNALAKDTENFTTTYILAPFVLCGSGTQNPAREDYCLNSCIEFTPQSQTVSIPEAGKLVSSRTFFNGTGETQNINEIGLYTRSSSSSGSSNNQSNQTLCLIARKVLDAPIKVNDKETFTIDYLVDFTNLTD